MSIIKINFDLKIPTGWLVDPDASVDNSTETLSVSYQGDDKCYVAVDENGDAPYGFGAVSEKEMNEGAPEQGEGFEWLEIDCTENPIFCSLHADLDPALAEEDGGQPEAIMANVAVTEGFAGFPPCEYNTLFEASDFYRTSQITILDSEPFLVPYTSMTHLFGASAAEDPVTWDDVKKKRDESLLSSDTQLAEDMPQKLKDAVLAYRTLLRDMPATLSALPAHLAYDMFPEAPTLNSAS
jgi:hypothetical protein